MSAKLIIMITQSSTTHWRDESSTTEQIQPMYAAPINRFKDLNTMNSNFTNTYTPFNPNVYYNNASQFYNQYGTYSSQFNYNVGEFGYPNANDQSNHRTILSDNQMNTNYVPQYYNRDMPIYHVLAQTATLDSEIMNQFKRSLGTYREEESDQPDSVSSSSSGIELTLKPRRSFLANLVKNNSETKQCLDAISHYMNALVVNSTANPSDGIMKGWETVKRSFISETKMKSTDYIVKEAALVHYYLSTIPSSWTEDDFLVFNKYISQETLKNKECLLDWAADAMKDGFGFDKNVLNQWESREMVAIEYFNMELEAGNARESTIKFKLAMYHMLTIFGSDLFVDHAMYNVRPHSNLKQELSLILNALKSYYFLLPFFEALDFITKLKGKIHKKHLTALYKILNRIESMIVGIFKKKELQEKSLRHCQNRSLELQNKSLEQHQKLSICDFLKLKPSPSGMLRGGFIEKISKDINDLINNWVDAIEASNNEKMTLESYLITIILRVLRDVLVTANDVGLPAARNFHRVRTQPDESRRRIFMYLAMLNFEFEKIRRLVLASVI